MAEITGIQLKFSCTENWDTMPGAEGGRHCDKCQKKVYDFTNSKADEFRQIMAENNGKVCGRFNKEQMTPEPIVLPFWEKWVSAAAMVLVGVNLFSCKGSNKQTLVGDTVMLPPADTTINKQADKGYQTMGVPMPDTLSNCKTDSLTVTGEIMPVNVKTTAK